MTVGALLGALRLLPPDAKVFVEYDEYPAVVGVFQPDADPDDPVGSNVVLIEIDFPPSE